jgi:hypothetical protein
MEGDITRLRLLFAFSGILSAVEIYRESGILVRNPVPWPVPAVTCPNCGTLIHRSQFATKPPWTCPTCSIKLRFSRNRSGAEGWIGLIASFEFCYVFGLRGWMLLIGGFLVWLPVSFVLLGILNWTWRPRLEQYYPPGEGHFTSLSLDRPDSSRTHR